MRDFQKLWNEKPWWKEGTTDKEMAEFYYKKGLDAKKEPSAQSPAAMAGSIPWTFNKPTEEGSYLYKQTDESKPMMVRVFIFKAGYTHQTFDPHLRFVVDDKHYPGVGVEMTGSESKWYGPIT